VAKLDFEMKTKEPYYAFFEESSEKAQGTFAAKYTLHPAHYYINTAVIESSIMLTETQRTICEIVLLKNNSN
jgi:hypothetical protein